MKCFLCAIESSTFYTLIKSRIIILSVTNNKTEVHGTKLPIHGQTARKWQIWACALN